LWCFAVGDFLSRLARGHSFVRASATGNERKSDRLPAGLHLTAWGAHNVSFGEPKAAFAPVLC